MKARIDYKSIFPGAFSAMYALERYVRRVRYTVSVWREAPFFSDRERAALAWT